jgi:hypothetical protein
MPTEATYAEESLTKWGILNGIEFYAFLFSPVEDTAHTWLRFAIIESQEDH